MSVIRGRIPFFQTGALVVTSHELIIVRGPFSVVAAILGIIIFGHYFVALALGHIGWGPPSLFGSVFSGFVVCWCSAELLLWRRERFQAWEAVEALAKAPPFNSRMDLLESLRKNKHSGTYPLNEGFALLRFWSSRRLQVRPKRRSSMLTIKVRSKDIDAARALVRDHGKQK